MLDALHIGNLSTSKIDGCRSAVIIHIKAKAMRALWEVMAGSDVWDVQVGTVDAPAWREILHCMVLDVSLHCNQAVAELQAHCALVGWGPTVSPQVLNHGRVVPWALVTDATLKGFLSLKQREEGTAGAGRKTKGGENRLRGPLFYLSAKPNFYEGPMLLF